MASSLITLPRLAKFQLVWRLLCGALLSSSSLARQKHPYLLSRLCLTYLGDIILNKGRFALNMKIISASIYSESIYLRPGSDVRSLNTTIVKGPIERHKSRLASHETGDGLTGTYNGGSLDWTESVPKWSREQRARAGLREAPGWDKPCARQALTTHSVRKCNSVTDVL